MRRKGGLNTTESYHTLLPPQKTRLPSRHLRYLVQAHDREITIPLTSTR